jgi:hypothetical protein
MKFLVIGHYSLDILQTSSGLREDEEPGGIYRAIRALDSFVNDGDVIQPVFGIHRSDARSLLGRLKQLPSLDTSGLYPVDVPAPRVHQPHDERNRGEEKRCAPTPPRPIPFDRIRPHVSADGILINMVSGCDITLETLDELRMAVRQQKTFVHLDFHNLTLGFGSGGSRYRRPLEEWRRWAFMIDTVQCNEAEIGGLTVERNTEQQTAGHLLTLGVKGVLVTRGERGVTLYRNERKRVARQDISVDAVEGLPGSVGCGDVFGASFLYHYLSSSDLEGAAVNAVQSTREYAQELSRSEDRAGDTEHPAKTPRSGTEAR